MSDYEIINFIASIKEVTGIDITNKSRIRKYVYSRVVFFDILKKNNPKITLTKMADFVDMDHSSVLYWLKQKKYLENYPDFVNIETTINFVKTHKHFNTLHLCNQIPYPNGKI